MGFKQSASGTPIAGTSVAANGGLSRLNGRRRDSQKPGDIAARPGRASRISHIDATLDRMSQKRRPEPYGKFDFSLPIFECR